MPLSLLIPAAGSLLGGFMQSNSNKQSAQTQANATTEAARIAADAQRFRPVGVTTAFGKSNFGTDAQGNLTSAGYTLSPELAAQRDYMLSGAGGAGIDWTKQGAAAGAGLFDLGRGYLATTPQQAAQDWMKSQQELLRPGQERAYAQLNQNLFNTGRGGFSIAQGGDLGMAAPETQAYYNSVAQQNTELAARAQAEGRAQTEFGRGLMTGGIDLTSQAYNPYKTQFGLAQSLETAGQGALNIGSELGGRAAQAGANVGDTLYAGGKLAAATMAPTNAYNPWATALNSPTLQKAISSFDMDKFNLNTAPGIFSDSPWF